jgi:hypothetical protein
MAVIERQLDPRASTDSEYRMKTDRQQERFAAGLWLERLDAVLAQTRRLGLTPPWDSIPRGRHASVSATSTRR